MRDPSLRGYAAVLAAAILWGGSGVAGKLLFGTGITPIQLVQLRLLIAVAALAGFFILRAPYRFCLQRWRDVAPLAVLGLVLAVTQVSYFVAINHIHVAAAILLQYMAPVLIAGFAFVAWGERVTWPKVAALLFALGGCYLVVGGNDLDLLRQNGAGIVAGFVSAIGFAAYSLLSERGMHRHDPWTVLFYALAAAAVALHLGYPPFLPSLRSLTLFQACLLLYVGVFGTAVPFGLYLVGVNHLRSTRASITGTVEPITAGVLAFLLLGEGFAGLQLVGACAVLLGVALLQLSREHDPRSPAHVRGAFAETPPAG
ncbi:MAG: DMT family transporter [Deferrisomatales bacterium]|nr:DMT family transporter [Deferrisomatales bacterium]